MTSSTETPADWVPVERRFLGMDRATLLPAAVVAALVALTAWILPTINSSIDVDDPIRAGDVVQVDSVEFVPATGWDLVAGLRQGEATTTGMYPGEAVLTSSGVTFEVIVDYYDGTAIQLLKQLERNSKRAGKDSAFEVTGRPTTIRNTDGDRGAAASFAAASSEGLLAAYVFDGVGVEVVAVGSTAIDDSQLADDVARMLVSVRPVTDGNAS